MKVSIEVSEQERAALSRFSRMQRHSPFETTLVLDVAERIVAAVEEQAKGKCNCRARAYGEEFDACPVHGDR